MPDPTNGAPKDGSEAVRRRRTRAVCFEVLARSELLSRDFQAGGDLVGAGGG